MLLGTIALSCNQLIVWFASILPKNVAGERAEAKKFGIFEKIFQPPVYHQNKGKGVSFFPAAVWIFICIICIYYVFVFICIEINT